MEENDRKKLTLRLNRVSGQLEGIRRMVNEDRYCVDILTQIAAIRGALDTVGVELLTSHLKTCVLGQGSKAAHKKTLSLSKDDLLLEVQSVVRRFLSS